MRGVEIRFITASVNLSLKPALMELWRPRPQLLEIKMGSMSNESFVEFLDSLKKAGVEITNEKEVRERLAETQRWRIAFDSLAMNGRLLGIRFSGHCDEAKIRRAFAAFNFPEKSEAIFAASLKASH